jgi:hypothetical protein
MTRSIVRAYQRLNEADRRRYRRLTAGSGVGDWIAGAAPVLSDDDNLWHSRFIQSFFPKEPTDPSRELAGAAELRKVAQLCFSQLLGNKPRRSEGNPGDWLCEGLIKGVPVSIELRYATRLGQLAYGVHAEGMARFSRVSAERLLGLGLGNWDLIYLNEVDQAFALLGELVTSVVDDHLAISKIIARNSPLL